MQKDRIDIKKETIIKDRYKIVLKIGAGGVGTTYKANDTQTQKIVVLKVLEISKIDNFKELELFEREIEVLKKINNPSIPDYYEHFQIDITGNQLYILVQEFIDGENLANLVKAGKSFLEKEIIGILKNLLLILEYLHDLNPPIIHRDINPKNIILDKNNKLFLVDFGAVGRGLKNTLTAAKSDTFVGTIGYMPQEQLFGKVHPGLDIYALGVTALFLLSGKAPWEFSIKNMKIDYQKSVKISLDLKYLIDKMIEPDQIKRLSNVKRTLSLIQEIEDLINDEPISLPAKTEIDEKVDPNKAEWLNTALVEQHKKNKKWQRLVAESKRMERIRLRREKKKANIKMYRAENFPRRAFIQEHRDGTELIIKPYSFFKLYFILIPIYFFGFSIGGIASPIVIWVFVIGLMWDFLGSFSIPIFLFGFAFIFYLIAALFLRYRDSELHVRKSGDNYCALFKKNPKKSIFAGKWKKLQIKTKKDDNTLPAGKGVTSPYWGSMEITYPENMQIKRTGLTLKDLEVINKFKKS